MGAWRNTAETQKSDHDPRSEPEIKNGRSSVKDNVLKMLRWTIQKEAS